MRYIAIAAFCAVWFATDAHPASKCAGPFRPFDVVHDLLEKRFQERRTAAALSGKTPWGDKLMVEIYVSRGGTVSVVITKPNGCSTLILSGTDYETIPGGSL